MIDIQFDVWYNNYPMENWEGLKNEKNNYNFIGGGSYVMYGSLWWQYNADSRIVR